MASYVEPREVVSPAWLAAQTGVDLRTAEAFHNALFHVLEMVLRADNVVLLPGIVHGYRPELVARLVEFDASRSDEDDELWELHGQDLARLVGEDDGADHIFTLSDLLPLLDEYVTLLEPGLSEDQFLSLVKAACHRMADQDIEMRFGLERVELESAIENWAVDHAAELGVALGLPSLRLLETSDGRSGRQYRFSNGRRADLICRTTEEHEGFPVGTWVVVEFKARIGVSEDVDQVNDYISLVENELAGPRDAVVGCLVADGFASEVAEYASDPDHAIMTQTITATGFYEHRFLEQAGQVGRFHSAGLIDMHRTLKDAGLAHPPIPAELRSQVQRLHRWRWSTTDVRDLDLYGFGAGVADSPTDGDWFAFGHTGHGANSWFLVYGLSYRGHLIRDRAHWGNMYEQPEREHENVGAMFGRIRAKLTEIEAAS